MTLATMRRGVVAFVIIAGVGRPLAAQRQQEMVPAVLANAALGMFFGGEFGESSIMPGRLPADFPTALKPPAPARLVGAAVVGPFRLAAFTYPSGTNLVGRYESLMVRAGATPAPQEPARGTGHGFAASLEPETTPQSPGFCLSGSSVSVSRADSVRAPHTVLVFWMPSMSRAGMHSRCDPDYAEYIKSSREVSVVQTGIELPPLVAPKGMRITGSGSSTSTSYSESSAWVDTSATADSLLSHFSRQFAQAGWTVGPVIANAETGAVSLSMTKGKELWRGGLYVLTGPDRRELVVRMLRAQPGRQ